MNFCRITNSHAEKNTSSLDEDISINVSSV